MIAPDDTMKLAHIAEKQPLAYLWYIRYCRAGHDAATCADPTCFICSPIRDLVIPLRDRPGEIARIAGALGSAGINIEDLAMRHASAADRGSLLLRVRAADTDRAVRVLEAADVEGVVVEPDPASHVASTGEQR